MLTRARFNRLFIALGVVVACAAPAAAQSKLGPLAQNAAGRGVGSSPVIVRAVDAASLPQMAALMKQFGGGAGRALPIIDGQAGWLPNAAITALANNPAVRDISIDRVVTGTMERTGATIGATDVRQKLGLDGTGVGVAVIDSGVTAWHDDLTGASGGQRVAAFVDFVNGRTSPYDDSGHGTHVAGIVAGNGFDSGGARAGIAPGASLIVLKALDASGGGRISNVIAALDYVLANKDALKIRIVNLSLASAVIQSYNTDPLTVAAKKVVNAGIVVVAAAGNMGTDAQGRIFYKGITSPGNAPWVLTVGASSHMGTTDRSDDTMAVFSSRGPTAVDNAAKPDIVAPGVGIESLSDPTSAFYTTKSASLLSGTVATSYLPYLSLTGTSMSAPVVAGTIALMLQANPSLTPNAVKAVLEYTSQVYPHYNRLTQGAGFLNARGAVELAAYLAGSRSAPLPSMAGWSRQLIWGNHLVAGGLLTASANAWPTNVTWGAALTKNGANVTWGVLGDGTPWKTSCADSTCAAVKWGPGVSHNTVWGNTCSGADCQGAWSLAAAGTALTTTSSDNIVVWGSSSDDGIVVWGSSSDDGIVVWGSSSDDGIVVWGSASDESIVVWGSASDDGIVVWGSNSDDGIVVWGSSSDEGIVVWGSDCAGCEPVVWGR